MAKVVKVKASKRNDKLVKAHTRVVKKGSAAKPKKEYEMRRGEKFDVSKKAPRPDDSGKHTAAQIKQFEALEEQMKNFAAMHNDKSMPYHVRNSMYNRYTEVWQKHHALQKKTNKARVIPQDARVKMSV